MKAAGTSQCPAFTSLLDLAELRARPFFCVWVIRSEGAHLSSPVRNRIRLWCIDLGTVYDLCMKKPWGVTSMTTSQSLPQAWQYAPVNRNGYQSFRYWGNVSQPAEKMASSAVCNFRDFRTHKLSNMAHQPETPWSKDYNRCHGVERQISPPLTSQGKPEP